MDLQQKPWRWRILFCCCPCSIRDQQVFIAETEPIFLALNPLFCSGNVLNSLRTDTGVPASERDKMKRKSVKEGESVTLDPGEIEKTNYSIMWYFNDTLIAEITGDQSKICTDEQCNERFRDRLKVNQTGSLTITNTRNTDSGEYKLQISNIRFSIIKIFSVTVIAVVAGINAVAVVLGVLGVLLLTAAVIYICRPGNRTNPTYRRTDVNSPDQSETEAAHETSQ